MSLFMSRCFQLAPRANGHTTPNPMVGAVLVHNGRVIGEGWHHHYGADHAEVNCIKNVIDADKHLIPESTMYVNLEPCAHYGITPPCAGRLVQERVGKVVIANTDPFEKVSGKGIGILREGGVEVETGVLEREGLWVNRRFFCYHSRNRPYIILKWARSRDGFIAPADGSRVQISSPESMQLVHKWRTEESAILVGAHTARNDDPQLTARLWKGKQPLRIVLDRKLTLPHTHHVFDSAAATWVINEEREAMQGNVHFVQIAFDEDMLWALMSRLYDARILSLIVEGGAQLSGSFIGAGLWDEARIFTGAPVLEKGVSAPVLTDGVHAFSCPLGPDDLTVFVNKQSAWPYVAGMEL
jgi:diaminohydroxyphosphoribosylaminopyrimidine deaminase/5-amino-6-(5-phosphoribosylamino)uracil reductase